MVTVKDNVKFSTLSISPYYMAAISTDKDVWIWGDVRYLNLEEQISNKTTDVKADRFTHLDTSASFVDGIEPTKLNLNFKVKSVSTGEKNIVIVSEAGEVWVSGSNYN